MGLGLTLVLFILCQELGLALQLLADGDALWSGMRAHSVGGGFLMRHLRLLRVMALAKTRWHPLYRSVGRGS